MRRDRGGKDRDEEREARIQELMERAQKELRSKRPNGQGAKHKPEKARKTPKKKK